MDNYESQKDFSMAMNGKLLMMVSGIFILFSSIAGNIFQGVGYIHLASDAGKGIEEAVKVLAEASFSSGQVMTMGIICLIVGIITGVGSILCVKFSNRLDKVGITFPVAILMLAVILIQQLIMMFVFHFASPMGVLSSLMMPLVLLWSTTRFKKLTKKYPDKVFAMDPNKKGRQQTAANGNSKSLMERAKVQVKDEEKAAQVVDEIQDTDQSAE